VTVEFWKARGYSNIEAINKVREFQVVQEKKVKNHKSNTTIQYFLDKGYSETDAISALKERQSTRLKRKYIEKYGEKVGTERYEKTNASWSTKMETQYRAGKFSKSPKTKVWKVTSSSELQLAETLQEKLGKPLLFGKNQLKIFDGVQYYYFDLCDIEHKKIIEYNGDYWHANPKKFSKNTIVRNGLSANDLWKKDIIKRRVANRLGYKILTIWESDYLKEPSMCIEKCLKFLSYGN
jgi:hypothetical protein